MRNEGIASVNEMEGCTLRNWRRDQRKWVLANGDMNCRRRKQMQIVSGMAPSERYSPWWWWFEGTCGKRIKTYEYSTAVAVPPPRAARAKVAQLETFHSLFHMRSRLRLSPSPHLPTYTAIAALACAIFLGFIRFTLFGSPTLLQSGP